MEGWGIFGRPTVLSFGIDESSRTIKVVDQCVEYSAANLVSTLEFKMLQNPTLVKTTNSFLIEVQDENSRGIALLTSGLVYTPTPGKVEDVNLISTKGTIIEQLVDLRLEFTPIHAVTGINYIKMRLPD